MRIEIFLAQPLSNLNMAGRNGVGPLVGDKLLPRGQPLRVLARTHAEAARTVARALSGEFPWSPVGIRPGDAIAISGLGQTRVYAVGAEGVVEIEPVFEVV
jgi:hypothetical protein